MHRGNYPALRVSGSVSRRDDIWPTQLRISDPTRACGYRDERRAIGPAHRGRGPAAPSTYTKAIARAVLQEHIVAATWAEHERRTTRATFASAAKALLAHLDRVEKVAAKTVADYRANIDARLGPTLGHRRLDEITGERPIRVHDLRHTFASLPSPAALR
jgi:hypothetical protein